MPIKQIQLRGISRVPSDRASADGGCAESLNVHLDHGETAPTLPPTEKDVYGQSQKSTIRFIHKMRGITNYIGTLLDGSAGHYRFRFRAYGSSISGGMSIMGDAVTDDGEMVRRFVSIGNTVIAYTSNRPFIFQFKNGSYVFLGTSIPRPNVEVASFKVNSRYATAEISDEYLRKTYDAVEWNAANTSGDEHYTAVLSAIDSIWDGVKLAVASAKGDGVFVAPFFLRYALRLYDGNYIYTSSPILCGGAVTDNWMRARLHNSASPSQDPECDIALSFLNAFTVYVKGDAIASKWGDIVQSIDFFASTPIYTPAMDAKFVQMNGGSGQWENEFLFEGMTGDERDKTILDEVLSKGQFYKIKSVELTDTVEMGKLTAGTLVLKNSDTASGDNLLLQDNMPDGYRDGAQYMPVADIQNFNSRLMLVGAEEVLSRGDSVLNGLVASGDWQSSPGGRSTYIFRYKIVDKSTGQAHYVLAHSGSDGLDIYQAYFANDGSSVSLRHGSQSLGSGTFKLAEPYAWLCYPDTRCTQVEVYWPAGTGALHDYVGKRFPMEPHPLLECAVAFLGYGVWLRNPGSAYETVYWDGDFTEDRIINADNKLLLSEFENPFLFPAGNIVTFPDKLIGAAGITAPLSEGQVGDFSVYVFTEGGIRVMIPTAEGTFAATMAHPNMARHVAVQGTILGMEQAVVFITDRGVMLLQGGTVTELSREMNGAPYKLDAAVRTALAQDETFGGMLAPTYDTATFMGFMRSQNTKVAYDFNGSRLLFFNATKAFQYEYRFETQSWHKLFGSYGTVTVLNSFPDCLVSYEQSGTPHIANFSTVLNDASILVDEPDETTGLPAATNAIIATRPFTLGEPDIRKAIRSIRIRGRYNRKDVKYFLLGSFDGLNWKRMTSLRGGSYKQFRIVIVASLMAMERITWIDVDYEDRFTNRLR